MSAWVGLFLCLGLTIGIVIALRRSTRVTRSYPSPPLLVMPRDASLLGSKAKRDTKRGDAKVLKLRPKKTDTKAKRPKKARGK